MTDDGIQRLLGEVTQIRKLLELLAEPAVAQRDAKLRDELRRLVGSSPKKQKAVFLMDGSRTQKQIIDQTAVDKGDLSTLVGKLATGGILMGEKKQPKLALSIPSNFFDSNARAK